MTTVFRVISTMTRLTLASSRFGVVRPNCTSNPSTPRKCKSALNKYSVSSARGPTSENEFSRRVPPVKTTSNRLEITFQAARGHTRSDRLKQRFHGEECAIGRVTKARMKADVNFKVENLRYFDQTRSLPVARHVLRLRKLKNRLPFRVAMKLQDLGSSESKNQSPNYKWHVILMLWGISFFNYADRQAVFSVFPLLEREMQLTPVQLGMLGSSFAWVYGLCAPLAGIIVDRVRRKTAILGGLHAWSFICMATALSRRFRQLLFFRAAVGLGETFYYPASMSMISDYHGKATRSRAMGIHQTSNYLGTIGGSFFSGWIGQCYGWRWSFIMFGALGILLGLFLNRRLIEPQRGAADFEDRGAREHLGTVNRVSPTQFLRIVWTTPTVLH